MMLEEYLAGRFGHFCIVYEEWQRNRILQVCNASRTQAQLAGRPTRLSSDVFCDIGCVEK